MTANSQLSTTEPKKQKQTKQTTRRGTDSQKWISREELSEERRRRETSGKGIGNKKLKW